MKPQKLCNIYSNDNINHFIVYKFFIAFLNVRGRTLANTDTDGMDIDDPDHLPWLETADDYEYDNSPSIFKIILFIFIALLAVAAVAASYYWYQNRSEGDVKSGNGDLIVAQEGDYKVAPEDPQGKDFEGEGDASFAVTEGQKQSAVIGKEETSAPIKTDGPVAAGTAAVQLGAFSDTDSAANAWSNLSKRFGFLSDSQRKIVEGTVDGGRKIYRLQAIASNAAQASDFCAKLKAAGENCLVVK